MELTNQQSLPVSQDIAWQALNDTEILKATIPGCESMTEIGDNEYEVQMVAAVGPVKAKFKGKLKLLNPVPPTSYEIAFEGQGGAAGHGKGTASVRLEAVGDSETVLHYTANAQVGGKIAQIGSRLIDMAAQKMATEFFAKFNKILKEKYLPADPEADAAAEAAKPKAGGWLKKLSGGG